jgi:aminoglycoside phosphotransferase family enzyme
MKTAMQELIELIRFTDKECYATMFNEGLFDKALEKEKEQIIADFEAGYKSCDLDEAFEINRKLASGELHYNKTYNQNK